MMAMYEIKNWKDIQTKDSSQFLETILRREGNALYDRIIDIIEQAIKHKQKEVIILKLEDVVLPKLISVNDYEYKLVLDIINNFCLSNEDYEACAIIQKIMKKLK